MATRLSRAFFLSSSLIPIAIVASTTSLANPLDGQVLGGSATISNPDATTLHIQQQTNSAIINWNSFNIAPNETTQFELPDSTGVTLNRVTGAQDPSIIQGTLKSNGTIFLINPDGILFSDTSVVDVGGIIATTTDIDNDAFMAGSRNFNKPGKPSASIVNEGNISVKDAGVAALVAPGVRNDGVIAAKLGKITLGAANNFTLDMFGDDLIKLSVDENLIGEALDVKTGKPLADKVKNSGKLKADGGVVALKAVTARKVVNSVINNTGIIEANTVGIKNGKIILSAGTLSTKTADAPLQKIKVSGKLEASGKKQVEKGGKVYVEGEAVEVKATKIDASGHSGGGAVLIGGDYLGGTATAQELKEHGIAFEKYVMATGTFISLDEMSSINVDALVAGNGGKAVVWSDKVTNTAATITAKGGAESGDGGFIETSGKLLNVSRAADASAANGKAGTWLLDPLDIHIKNAADNNYDTFVEEMYPGIVGDSSYPNDVASVIDTDTVEAALNAGTNVRVITRNTTGAGNGDIYIEDDIRKTAGGNVFANINAAGNIYFSSGVDLISTSGAVTLHVYATDGGIYGTNVGRIDVNGGQLLFESTDGVDFHSNFDMPDLFTLSINSLGPSSLPRVDVDVSFDDDIIKFWHNNTTATAEAGSLQLVDSTAEGQLQVTLRHLNVALRDNAALVENERLWSVDVDADKAIGTVTPDAVNGIPEIISDGSESLPYHNAQVSGIRSVVEVIGEADDATAYSCGTLKCIITGPAPAPPPPVVVPPVRPVPQAILSPETNFDIAMSTPPSLAVAEPIVAGPATPLHLTLPSYLTRPLNDPEQIAVFDNVLSNGFDPGLDGRSNEAGVWATLLSIMAYENEAQVAGVLKQLNIQSVDDKFVHKITLSNGDVKQYILGKTVVDGKTTYIVSIEGTALTGSGAWYNPLNYGQWVEDFKLVRSEFREDIAFHQYSMLLATAVQTDLYGNREVLKSIADGTFQVQISGHSLGGSAAEILNFQISSTPSKGNNSISTYTIAAPNAGNKAFANYVKEKNLELYGFVSKDDLIALQPFTGAIAGEQIYVGAARLGAGHSSKKYLGLLLSDLF